MDRFASWAEDWRRDYEAGGLFLADRYSTANAVHQASKLPEAEREAFFRWLADFEYDKLGLPRPDLVFYLDMPTDVSETLVQYRSVTSGRQVDIHEQNDAYLRLCRQTARQAAAFYGWTVIPCMEGGILRSPEAIHNDIFAYVADLLYISESSST